MRKLVLLAVSAAGISACAPVPYAVPGGGKCRPDQGQGYLGQMATFETGQKILDETKAKTFRWAGPDKMLTMELDPNRVTVYYDKAGTITKIACG
jgi:hypothetical protein